MNKHRDELMDYTRNYLINRKISSGVTQVALLENTNNEYAILELNCYGFIAEFPSYTYNHDQDELYKIKSWCALPIKPKLDLEPLGFWRDK